MAALCVSGDADAAVAPVAGAPEPETDAATRAVIAKCFSADTLDGVMAALAAEGGNFAAATLETIAKRSPTSLKVAFRQIRAGASLSMDACMRMEFRILNRMLAGTDFYEGIRAAIVDKDGAPQWRPAALNEVDDAAVQAYFAPLPGGDLVL